MQEDLNKNLKNLGTETAFGFSAEVMALEMSGKFDHIYKFHVGDTGPKTADAVIEVAIQALRDKQTKYGHYLGHPNVRDNIAKYFNETRNTNITKDNIILVPGGKPIIELTIQALVNDDEYIIGQNPGYPIYESLARFYTKDKYIPWYAKDEEGQLEFFVEDLENILKKNNKIKLLIINTPQNPTGTMLTENKLRDIANLAIKYDFYILFDDIYDQIVFGSNKHLSLLSIPEVKDRVINLQGFSKDYAMTGWRMGFGVAPAWLIEKFGQLAINKWTALPTVFQIVAGAMFGDVEVNGFKYQSVKDEIHPIVKKDVIEYEKKGRFVYEALQLIKEYVVPNKPEGAFYIFPNIKKVLELDYVKNKLGLKNSSEFSYWLLREKGFAALAGSDFGLGGEGYIRFSYAEDVEKHIVPGMKYFIEIILDLLEKSGKDLPIKKEDLNNEIEEIKNKIF